MEASNLAVVPTGSDSARLTWNPALYNGLGYVIFRGLTAVFQDAIQIDNVGINDSVFNDYNLTPGTKYWWWVLIPTNTPAGPVTTTTRPLPVAGPFFEDLLEPLYDWAFGVVNKPVVWAHQSGPKPEKPFVELLLTGPLKVPGTDHTTENDQLISGMRRWNVSVHCFTEPYKEPGDIDAMGYAGMLIASLDDPGITDAFNAAQMGVADVEPVTDVSALLETKFERHAHFDFSINVPSNVLATVVPGAIATVSLGAGTFNPG